MEEERRRPARLGDARRDADARIEALTRQLADIINGAGAEHRQDLREYAVGLLRDETEVIETATPTSGTPSRTDSNSLGIALLIGVAGLVMLLVMPPIGVTMLVVAVVTGLVGVIGAFFRK